MTAITCRKDTRSLPVFHIFHLITLLKFLPLQPFLFIEILFLVPNFMQTAKEYKLADLTPMESGCCRPPAEYAPECILFSGGHRNLKRGHHIALIFRCGYPALNASYFDLSFHPVSTNVDCKLYKNTRSVRCYDCNSCK